MKLTQIIVLGLVVAVVVYDIVAYSVWGVGATVSRVTLGWASGLPIIALAIGVVIGHLFWPQKEIEK